MSLSANQQPADYKALQQRLGHCFHDLTLLRLALTHPSITKERGAASQTNQRLEFLGDAVLAIVLSRALYEKYATLDEGMLTKARARLVNGPALASHARKLDLGAELILSRGEETQGGRDRNTALADAFEAILGALYLDGGMAAAEVFILRDFNEELNAVSAVPVIANPKGELQEFLQAASPEAPRYEIVAISGPDHERAYACRVLHEGRELARGEGNSKKAAESMAAQAALALLRAEALSQNPSSS